MNAEIQDIRKNKTPERKVTIPDNPLEIRNLAQSFNNLLSFQNNALKREQQFVSDASHELKTPIAAIRGHVNLIKRRGQSNPEIISTSLDYIDSESKKMQLIVNELLTLGRIDQNNDDVTPIDLVKIVSDVVNEVQTVYPQKIISNLPEQLLFPIKPTDFRNIAHNLVENAAKYSPADSEINVVLKKQADKLLFQVADHGIGISPGKPWKDLQTFLPRR